MSPADAAIVIAGGAAFSLLTYLVLVVPAQRTRSVLSRVGRAGADADFDQTPSLRRRILDALPLLDVVVVSSQREVMRRKLRRLGHGDLYAMRSFAAIKLTGAVTLGLVGLALGSTQPAAAFLLGIVFFVLGLYVPDVVVDRRLQAAEVRILNDLPATIDLLNICIRSGMNLEKGIARVTEEVSGPLAIDFRIITDRTRLGDSVEDAVKHLSADQELSVTTSAFLSTISRATRFGVPLGNVVQQTADDMRKQQIDVIKTQAAKLPVKILLPLMLFLLPAVLLIVLGPAVLSLIDGFAAL